MIRQTVREFAEKEIVPGVASRDEKEEFDCGLICLTGLPSWDWPESSLPGNTLAARLQVYQAAWRAEQGLSSGKNSAMAKMYASETAMLVKTE